MHEHDFAYTVEEKNLKSEHLKKIFTLEDDLVKTWSPAQVRGGKCWRKRNLSAKPEWILC